MPRDEHNNNGKVALWKNPDFNKAAWEDAVADGQNYPQPIFRGTVVAHRDIRAGETIELSLWLNDKDGNEKRPDLTGKVKDEYRPRDREARRDDSGGGRSGSRRPAPRQPDLDDDIPF